MDDLLTYNYLAPSALLKDNGSEALFLSQYSEIQKSTDVPCFFLGRVKEPFTMARCLVALSNVVKSSFNLSPFQLALLKDPIVTAGNSCVRFEGFSHCAGVYARVDLLADALDGEFLANGTTNVDFNQPMLTALSSIQNNENVMLSIGQKEVGLDVEGKTVVERKVPLPVKWIKGLSSVQIYLSQSEISHTFNKIQTQQLFRSMPKGQIKTDYFLVIKGNTPLFSPMKSEGAICLGGLHRLRLLEPLLPFMKQLQVFAHSEMQATTWQFSFGSLRFSLSLSRDPWRGFSGEGATLDALIDDVSQGWMDIFEQNAYANQTFDPSLFTIKESPYLSKTENVSAQLAAMGLLGFDLNDNVFFYRQLPFKISRIMQLNPRLKGAEKLIVGNKVEIIQNTLGRIEARVEGSGIFHTVIFDGNNQRCTCEWYGKHQGARGPCKHVLAVKKMVMV